VVDCLFVVTSKEDGTKRHPTRYPTRQHQTLEGFPYGIKMIRWYDDFEGFCMDLMEAEARVEVKRKAEKARKHALNVCLRWLLGNRCASR
jgi:hypothetical protein